ncbi:MAG: OmpH family outer membrane protein [Muribaculaceae bacterium]|nr:OmpH family outer membrane protein [Muribaculaceae bacterium]
MNFIKHYTKLALFAAVVLMASTSCNDNKTAEAPKTADGKAVETLKIRYIDEDSIMANYNLAKDINEAMLRRQNQFDAAQKQRGNEISKFGNAMQQKYQNNQYLTEEAFNADQVKLQKMQTDAENYLANLQQSIQNELNQSQIQLLDSIDNFMKDYAKKKGFDMVLRKSATLYIDPKFDVTDEVIEGLNKRYNKVGGSTATPAPAKPVEAAPAKPAADKATGLSTEKPATPGKVDLKKKD